MATESVYCHNCQRVTECDVESFLTRYTWTCVFCGEITDTEDKYDEHDAYEEDDYDDPDNFLDHT